MTDQFQFEPQDGVQDPDEGEPEQGVADRLDDPLDEGYAPAEPWSTGAVFGGQPVDEVQKKKAFEQRLEQEEPEVEDDWDEDLSSEAEGDVGDDRPGAGLER